MEDQVNESMEWDEVLSTEVSKFEESVDSNVGTIDLSDSKISEVNTNIEVHETRYENRNGTFTTGIDIFSKEERLKMEERAKRFGTANKIKPTLNEDQDLYASMGIVEESENLKNLRLNVIHMRGTEEMSTEDVFKYFEDYAPASIEWINDVSCNVVWLDNVSAARALLGLSKRIKGLGDKVRGDKYFKSEASTFDEENSLANNDCVVEIVGDDVSIGKTEDNLDENTINLKDIKCPLPPGLWRKGVDYLKSNGIILRFATRADKKQPNAEKMSEYYKKHGNPNFGGIKGILTESRKRMYKESKQSRKKSKVGALDDTARTDTKNPWGALSHNWGVNDSIEDDFSQRGYAKDETNDDFSQRDYAKDQTSSIKERLGFKDYIRNVPHTSEESGSDSDDNSDGEWSKRSKVPRMRMHADDEEEKVQKRRSRMQKQMSADRISNSNDLRSRLGKLKKMPVFPETIQVVVKNTRIAKASYSKRDKSLVEEGEIVEGDGEKEEGEWQEEDVEEEEGEIEVEDEEGGGEGKEVDEEEDSDEDDELSEKEIQGPRGSVIKVVQNKPRLASTVWARLNHIKVEETDDSKKQRRSTRGDLRDTLKGGDLRARLNHQSRGRSPLRIEVKNDKYTVENSDTE